MWPEWGIRGTCISQRERTTRKTKTEVDNIKMDLVEIGLGDLDWIVLA
jgi:hypothetical protein